jgi:uncharacterized membrane protein YfcA
MTDLPWQDLFALLAVMTGTGIFAGIVAGLLGVGGGIVTVPLLFFLLGTLDVAPEVRMHVAVGTSLAIIVPTSLRSAWEHYRRNAVDMGFLRTITPGLLVGVILGVLASTIVSGRVLTGVFGVMAILIAARLFFHRRSPALTRKAPGEPAPTLIGMFVGSVSTMMGVGGGALTVPILEALRYEMHRAVGTAAAVGTIISVPAFLGFIWAGMGIADRPPLSLGYVNLPGLLLIAPLSVALAPLGVRLSHALNAQRLKQTFAVFLFLTAITMLTTTWVG